MFEGTLTEYTSEIKEFQNRGVVEIQSSIWVGACCLESYWLNPPTAFSDILHLSCFKSSDSTSEDYNNNNCSISTKI